MKEELIEPLYLFFGYGILLGVAFLAATHTIFIGISQIVISPINSIIDAFSVAIFPTMRLAWLNIAIETLNRYKRAKPIKRKAEFNITVNRISLISFVQAITARFSERKSMICITSINLTGSLHIETSTRDGAILRSEMAYPKVTYSSAIAPTFKPICLFVLNHQEFKNSKTSVFFPDVSINRRLFSHYESVLEKLQKWNKEGGVVRNGLVKRREMERTLFESPL